MRLSGFIRMRLKLWQRFRSKSWIQLSVDSWETSTNHYSIEREVFYG
jgi:hypothetical protein